MKRVIVRPLAVWDRNLRIQTELSPGTYLSSFVIVRGQTASDEPYRVEFQVSGRDCWCALNTFLPRTQCVSSSVAAERETAGQAVAV